MSRELSNADRTVIERAISGAELSCQYALAEDLRAILTRASAATVAEPSKDRDGAFDWLETEISAVDCRYRGDPSYDHDAYWMRDRALKLVQEAKAIFGKAAQQQAEPGAAQIGMRDRKYVDSTPHLHVGNSAFEDWYQQHPKACVSDKQLARDAYAAGMGDPLVMARDAAQQQAQPECPRCGLTVSPESCDCAEARAARVKQRAEPAADEWAEFETALKQYAEACHRSESCSAMDAARARVCAIFSRAAQSGQRAGVAEYLQQIARAIEEDHPEQAYNLRLFIAGAAPTQQGGEQP